MAWYLDNTRIFVTERDLDNKQIIARLQPVGAGTIYHTFGYENRVAKITAYVVGDVDYGTLEGMTHDGVTHLFSGASGYVYPYYVNSFNAKQVNSVAQTLRPDLPCDSTVWLATIELYKET